MKTLKPRVRTVLKAAFACTALAAIPTAGIADAAFDGSKARVNLSNKLSMLTQTIASASCRIDAGINPNQAVQDLAIARYDFNAILDGLENGGMALGIPAAERYAVVLKSIQSVRDQWAPVDTAADALINAGAGANSAAETIARTNLALLDATNILASDVTGKYSNPHELTQADAMALHIAGRQRMLSHRMAKEVCGIATNQATVGTTDDLSATVDMYQVSLNALRDGMVVAGVNPPPTKAIAGELEGVNEVWAANFPALTAISTGTPPSTQNVDTVAQLSSHLMKDMSNIVTLYMLATPGQEDVYRVPLMAYAEKELAKWIENPSLIQAIMQQNNQHSGLDQAAIDQLDLDWRAQRKQDSKPLIADLLGRPSSEWLRDKQAETAQFVTEVFAMDNRGLNVAQSVETSDYWQGDEGKWQKTYGNGSGSIHISEVEFDESTGTYQSQVSMAIKDPTSGELIGAITFGVNVQSLL